MARADSEIDHLRVSTAVAIKPFFYQEVTSMNIARGSLGLFLCVICASLSTVTVQAQSAAPAQAPQTATPPPPPPTPIPFDAALLKAANDLFTKANLSGSPDK